jgi:hypothetical protein
MKGGGFACCEIAYRRRKGLVFIWGKLSLMVWRNSHKKKSIAGWFNGGTIGDWRGKGGIAWQNLRSVALGWKKRMPQKMP